MRLGVRDLLVNTYTILAFVPHSTAASSSSSISSSSRVAGSGFDLPLPLPFAVK